MSISTFDTDVEVISKLSDTPNDTLTAGQLKAKFDQAAVAIKGYINNTLVAEINASGTVDTAKLADNAVTTAKIKNANVTTDKLEDGAITAAKIASNAVTAAKIYSGAVTTAKIADGNVTTAKIADGNVTKAKVNFVETSLGSTDDKVPTSKAVAEAIAGHVIPSGSVTAGMLASDAVETAKIKNGNVTTAKIADGNVTTAKIADGNVTAAKLASNAVETAKIKDANVTMAKTNFVKTTLDGTKDTEVPTSKAVKDYVMSDPMGILYQCVSPLPYKGTLYQEDPNAIYWSTLQTPIVVSNYSSILLDSDIYGVLVSSESSPTSGITSYFEIYFSDSTTDYPTAWMMGHSQNLNFPLKYNMQINTSNHTCVSVYTLHSNGTTFNYTKLDAPASFPSTITKIGVKPRLASTPTIPTGYYLWTYGLAIRISLTK